MPKTIVVGPCRDVPFGDVVRQVWELSGLTKREFARRLGVQPPRVIEIFASESITEHLLDRCMCALNVQLEVRVLS